MTGVLTKAEDFAHKVHLEMRTAYPHWRNIDNAWRAIPDEERSLAREKMGERCGDLLQARGNHLASLTVQSAIDARLYQARRTWIRNRQKASRVQHDLANTADIPDNEMESSSSIPRNVMNISSIIEPS